MKASCTVERPEHHCKGEVKVLAPDTNLAKLRIPKTVKKAGEIDAENGITY
jgi:hypothetical protein